MRAVVYLRVSTEGQVDAWGFDVQTFACQTYAEARGIEVVDWIRDEAVTGKSDAADRPGLLAALTLLREGEADLLLVARLDRLARHLTVQEAILAEVWSLGAEVHTCDLGPVQQDDPDDPMRTAIRQVVGVFAQLDRALTVKRLRDGRRAKAAAGGKASGSYPFGYTRHGEDDREQGVLDAIRILLSRGATLEEVATYLNHRPNCHPRHAARWTRQTVGAVVARAGLRAAPLKVVT